MKKLFFWGLLLVSYSQPALAQQADKPTYMQIFYNGANWLAGRPVLYYSPAFRSKIGELVAEPDSTRQLSAEALFLGPSLAQSNKLNSGTRKAFSVTTTGRVYNTDAKPSAKDLAQEQQERKQELARFNRSLSLLEARAALAHNALTKALNEVAADGWEIAQVTSAGSHDELVYLLRRR